MKGYLAYDENIKGKDQGCWLFMNGGGTMNMRAGAPGCLRNSGMAPAVDMYGDGKQAMHPDDAGKFSSGTDEGF
jgi:hypothetical protein